jgi:hypothetical protein
LRDRLRFRGEIRNGFTSGRVIPDTPIEYLTRDVKMLAIGCGLNLFFSQGMGVARAILEHHYQKEHSRCLTEWLRGVNRTERALREEDETPEL